MFKRVTFLTAAVSLTLLLAGCGGTLGPAPEQTQIRFEAGSLLLLEDGTPSTKFGAPIEGTSFSNGASFLVYGRHNTDSPLVFNAREVSLSGGSWSYTDPEQWDWSSNSDYYDFLAMYLGDLNDPNRLTTPVPSCNTGNPMYASVSYNPAQDQFDLMLAGKRRTYDAAEGRTSTVGMTFEHMLCAVQVRVGNGSSSTAFTLNGYHFENLISRGTAKVEATYDAQGKPTLSWTGTSRLATSVGGTANLTPAQLDEITIIPYTFYPGQVQDSHTYYDLMIPQTHSEKIGANGWPMLVLEYTPYGGVSTTAQVYLKDIYTNPAQGDPTLISSWERSRKYVYEVILDLDGGVQVHVTTSNWDAVEAETPGLLLPTFY